MNRKNALAGLVVSLGLCVCLVFSPGDAADRKEKKKAKGPSKAAVERTRKQVRMLDDLYKTAVVLITTHYVEDEGDFPAGGAAIALFDAMKKKGWHEVRLIDASGEPLEEANAPKDDFEKTAVKSLLAGKTNYEQIIQKDGVDYLRVATPVPVVLKKCTLCHDNYNGVKEGVPVGALSYQLKIE